MSAGFGERTGILDAVATPAFSVSVPVPSPAPPAPGEARDAAFETDPETLGRRLLRDGADALDDRALLALLFGLVLREGADAAALAGSAFARFGSFAAVLAADERALRLDPLVNTHVVAACRLLHDAALRLARSGLLRRRVLDDRARLDAYLAAVLGRERIEQFRVLFLDADGGLVADEAQARGTVNHTPVYPREVVRRAIELDAASVVLVHNHPSGDPSPSEDDLEMTREVAAAAAVLGIAVRDHLIVGNGRTFSFRDDGLLA